MTYLISRWTRTLIRRKLMHGTVPMNIPAKREKRVSAPAGCFFGGICHNGRFRAAGWEAAGAAEISKNTAVSILTVFVIRGQCSREAQEVNVTPVTLLRREKDRPGQKAS